MSGVIPTDDLAAVLNTLDFDEILSSGQLNWDDVENKKDVIGCAVHCCLNGPVGVNKTTTFIHLTTDTSIKRLSGNQLTNRTFKSVCDQIKQILKDDHGEVVAKSWINDACGDIWPCDEYERLMQQRAT
jgi:hypothetical protein